MNGQGEDAERANAIRRAAFQIGLLNRDPEAVKKSIPRLKSIVVHETSVLLKKVMEIRNELTHVAEPLDDPVDRKVLINLREKAVNLFKRVYKTRELGIKLKADVVKPVGKGLPGNAASLSASVGRLRTGGIETGTSTAMTTIPKRTWDGDFPPPAAVLGGAQGKSVPQVNSALIQAAAVAVARPEEQQIKPGPGLGKRKRKKPAKAAISALGTAAGSSDRVEVLLVPAGGTSGGSKGKRGKKGGVTVGEKGKTKNEGVGNGERGRPMAKVPRLAMAAETREVATKEAVVVVTEMAAMGPLKDGLGEEVKEEEDKKKEEKTEKKLPETMMEDHAPRRVTNPLLELPRYPEPNGSHPIPPELIPNGGEVWNIAEVYHPRPDTYPMSYYARLLGFNIPASAPDPEKRDIGGAETTPTFDPATVPFADRDKDAWLYVPRPGRFADAVLSRRRGGGGGSAEENLDFVDPMWSTILNNYRGYDGRLLTPAALQSTQVQSLSSECLKFAKARGLMSRRKEVGVGLDVKMETTLAFRFASPGDEEKILRLDKVSFDSRKKPILGLVLLSTILSFFLSSAVPSFSYHTSM